MSKEVVVALGGGCVFGMSAAGSLGAGLVLHAWGWKTLLGSSGADVWAGDPRQGEGRGKDKGHFYFAFTLRFIV